MQVIIKGTVVALIDPTVQIKQLRDFEDKLADGITAFAGNVKFVYLHAIWFGAWIAAGLGSFGPAYEFDRFPFGLLTMIVSLEAIFLSTFVMISQNRDSKKADIRSKLDFQTNVQAEREVSVIMKTLERLAKKQGVNVDDLVEEMDNTRRLAVAEVNRKSK
jgi:uncharacterized membrane protein